MNDDQDACFRSSSSQSGFARARGRRLSVLWSRGRGGSRGGTGGGGRVVRLARRPGHQSGHRGQAVRHVGAGTGRGPATAVGGRQTAGRDHDLAPRRRLSPHGGLGTLRRRFGYGRGAGRVARLAGRNRATARRTHAVRIPAGHRSSRAEPVAGKGSWGRAADRPAGAGYPRVRCDEVPRIQPADNPRIANCSATASR